MDGIINAHDMRIISDAYGDLALKNVIKLIKSAALKGDYSITIYNKNTPYQYDIVSKNITNLNNLGYQIIIEEYEAIKIRW